MTRNFMYAVNALFALAFSTFVCKIFFLFQEERNIMRQHSALFDEQSYAQLGIVSNNSLEGF